MKCENSIFSNGRSAQWWPTLSHVVQHTLCWVLNMQQPEDLPKLSYKMKGKWTLLGFNPLPLKIHPPSLSTLLCALGGQAMETTHRLLFFTGLWFGLAVPSILEDGESEPGVFIPLIPSLSDCHHFLPPYSYHLLPSSDHFLPLSCKPIG